MTRFDYYIISIKKQTWCHSNMTAGLPFRKQWCDAFSRFYGVFAKDGWAARLQNSNDLMMRHYAHFISHFDVDYSDYLYTSAFVGHDGVWFIARHQRFGQLARDILNDWRRALPIYGRWPIDDVKINTRGLMPLQARAIYRYWLLLAIAMPLTQQ